MAHLNWLHFTDLHTDMSGHNWTWPRSQKLLFDDLSRLHDAGVGPWDLVLFSGDLTQSATKEQFEKFSDILVKLWQLFHSFGYPLPIFLSVPGNHDLVRPLSTSSVVKAFKLWHEDEEVRNLFWQSGSNEYRQVVVEAFSNYTSWCGNLSLPKPEKLTTGILPGEFSTIIKKGGIKLGVIGLNTAFLQLTDQDYEGQLDIHQKQLFGVCNEDPDSWCDNVDIALLLTHHGSSWLSTSAQSCFSSEIFPPGRFFSHIHGHLHTPHSSNFSNGGAREQRFRQGPSLFGLESWGTEKTERIQGYTAGRFEINDSSGSELLWPRRLVKKMAGHHRIDPDLSYDLDESNSIVTTFQLNVKNQDKLSGAQTISSDIDEISSSSSEAELTINNYKMIFDVDVSLLSDELSKEQSNAQLKKAPRISLNVDPQHYHIRQREKARLESLLLNDRCAWLIYDWGQAKDSFVACVLTRINQNKKLDVFRFLCDDIDDSSDIESHFKKQFGITLQEFCIYTSRFDNTVLVIDEISPILIKRKTESRERFDRIVSSVLDFSENLYLILASRQSQQVSDFEAVELTALDLPDVANYINNHPKSRVQTGNGYLVEELYRYSEGLPMHLDRLIETLQVASLRDLADLEYDTPLEGISLKEPVPRALMQAVASLSTSTEKYTRRSFNMLKVLSVLPEGETLQAIKRLYPTKPFYTQNAIELINLSLLTADLFETGSIRLTTESLRGNLTDEQDNKYLCVPRQVRDYVNTLLTNDERYQIVSYSADLLFGEKWREGIIKMSRAKTQGTRGTISTGPGNEHSVIRHLLRNAIQKHDIQEIKRNLLLANNYCQKLRENNCYNDICIATDEFLTLIEKFDLDEQYAELAIVRGQALRMIGEHELALKVLTTVLDMNTGFLTNDQLTSIYINIALLHQTNNHSRDAIDAAKMVQTLTSKDSGNYMQAESIKISFTEEPIRTIKLRTLEKKARAKKNYVTANNIALDLCRSCKDNVDKLSFLETVLTAPDDPYNKIRAVIRKANILSKIGKMDAINSSDRKQLNFAYSVLYAQRLTTLFTSCHEAIWSILKAESNFKTLLLAFRLSSFLWRIRGEEKLEQKYLDDIKLINLEEIRQINDESVKTNISYLDRRMAQKLLVD